MPARAKVWATSSSETYAETDAIIHVLRCFDDDNITHVDGSIDPIRDKEIIDTELQLKDLETIEGRLSRQQKVAAAGNKEAKIEVWGARGIQGSARTGQERTRG